MKRELFTANGLATELGLDRRAVALALGGVRPDGKVGSRDGYTLRTFFAATKAAQTPASASNDDGAADDAGSGSYAHERARLTREKARIAELQRLELERRLVPAEQIGEAWAAMGRVLRQRLLAVPSKCASQFAMARTAAEAQALLKREIDEALNELATMQIEVEDAA